MALVALVALVAPVALVALVVHFCSPRTEAASQRRGPRGCQKRNEKGLGQWQSGREMGRSNDEGREIRTPNLLIWSQTRCRCAIPPMPSHPSAKHSKGSQTKTAIFGTQTTQWLFGVLPAAASCPLGNQAAVLVAVLVVVLAVVLVLAVSLVLLLAVLLAARWLLWFWLLWF